MEPETNPSQTEVAGPARMGRAASEGGDGPSAKVWARIRKCAPPAAKASKFITGLAALGGAVVVITAWFPMAYDNIWPNEKAYGLLEGIHAGYSVDYIKSKLGVPVTTAPTGTPGEGLTLMTFPEDKYLVSVIAKNNEVELYSVLSCASDFRPHFVIPGSAGVTLQAENISDVGPASPGDAAFTQLAYEFGGDGQTERASELVAGSGTMVLEGMSLVYGTNWACPGPSSRPDVTGSANASYSGALSQTTPFVKAIRSGTLVNFFAELAPGFDPCHVEASVQCPEQVPNTELKVSPTPSQFEAPPGFFAKFWPATPLLSPSSSVHPTGS